MELGMSRNYKYHSTIYGNVISCCANSGSPQHFGGRVLTRTGWTLLPFSPFCAPLCRPSADTRAASRTCGIGWSSRRAPTAACRTTSTSSSLPTTTFLGKVLCWAPPAALTRLSEGTPLIAPFFKRTEGALFQKPYWYREWDGISGSLLGGSFYCGMRK